MNEIILQNKDGQVLVSSRDVAEHFNKKHSEVIYTLEGRIGKDGTVKNNGILMSGNSQLSKMFIKTEYKDSMNRTKHEYLMNRDGFSLLCMGFTGKEALEWKLKYIDAFNKMEEKLKSGNHITNEDQLKLQLFDKDPLKVVQAHQQLVSIEVNRATAPLIAENEEMKPKAEFHDAISVAENCVSFGKFAATFQNNNKISFGRNKIMEWCRLNDYLCSSYNLKNKPSQKMIDNGYMKYKQNVNNKNGKEYITYTPLLTGKGEIWLTKKLLNYLKNDNLLFVS